MPRGRAGAARQADRDAHRRGVPAGAVGRRSRPRAAGARAQDRGREGCRERQARRDPAKMVDGAVAKFAKENALLSQLFVMDNKTPIADVVARRARTPAPRSRSRIMSASSSAKASRRKRAISPPKLPPQQASDLYFYSSASALGTVARTDEAFSGKVGTGFPPENAFFIMTIFRVVGRLRPTRKWSRVRAIPVSRADSRILCHAPRPSAYC
jgi:hypothetical protein